MCIPTVSIGLPVYNGAAYLPEAIDALLAQDFRDFELIISDNASTDTTEEVCRAFAKADPRVRYVRNEKNLGAAPNYNRVFELAQGRYFKWATHDDLCLPGYLSACLKAFEESPESVVLVYTLSKFIDEHGTTITADSDTLETRSTRPHRRLAHVLHHVNMANAIFGLIRTDVLRKTRLIGPFIASDYVLLGELALLGEIAEIPERLFLRRLHPDGSRFANRTNEQVQAWFDPNRSLRFKTAHRLFPRTMVRTRLVAEWMRSVCRLPIGGIDRATCLLTVPIVYSYSRFRCLAGGIKQSISGLAGSREQSLQ